MTVEQQLTEEQRQLLLQRIEEVSNKPKAEWTDEDKEIFDIIKEIVFQKHPELRGCVILMD